MTEREGKREVEWGGSNTSKHIYIYSIYTLYDNIIIGGESKGERGRGSNFDLDYHLYI